MEEEIGWEPVFKPREQLIYRCGASRKKVTVIGPCERKNVYRVELMAGAYTEAHECQLKRIKKPEHLFITRYIDSVVYPDGLSVPRKSLEDAIRRPTAAEVLEVRVIRRHPIIQADIPPRPDFLKK